MTVIFDLDYTLLDTTRFKDALFEALTSCGPDRELVERTYKEVVSRKGETPDYDPEAHVQLLCHGGRCNPEEAKIKIKEVLARTGEFLFKEAGELLTKLRARGDRLVLLTLGNKEWQRTKIEQSDIGRYFDMIETTDEKKVGVIKNLIEAGEPAIVVNDNGGEIAEMMSAAPDLKYILIRGPKPVPGELKLVEAASIQELAKLLGIELRPPEGDMGDQPSTPKLRTEKHK